MNCVLRSPTPSATGARARTAAAAATARPVAGRQSGSARCGRGGRRSGRRCRRRAAPERVPAVLRRPAMMVAEVAAPAAAAPTAAQQPAQPRSPPTAEELAPHADDEPKRSGRSARSASASVMSARRRVAGQRERLLELSKMTSSGRSSARKRRGEPRPASPASGCRVSAPRAAPATAVAGPQRHDPPAVEPREARPASAAYTRPACSSEVCRSPSRRRDADGRLGAEDAEQLGDLGAAAEEQIGVALGEARQPAVRRHELERGALLRAAERARRAHSSRNAHVRRPRPRRVTRASSGDLPARGRGRRRRRRRAVLASSGKVLATTAARLPPRG